MKKYKNARYQRKNDRKTDELLGMLQESSLLMEYIEKEYPYDRERIEVLKKILLAAGNNSFEEMEQNIFLLTKKAFRSFWLRERSLNTGNTILFTVCGGILP